MLKNLYKKIILNKILIQKKKIKPTLNWISNIPINHLLLKQIPTYLSNHKGEFSTLYIHIITILALQHSSQRMTVSFMSLYI